MDNIRKDRGALKGNITRMENGAQVIQDAGTAWTFPSIQMYMEKIDVITAAVTELQKRLHRTAKDNIELDPEEAEVADMERRLDSLKVKLLTEKEALTVTPNTSVTLGQTTATTPTGGQQTSTGSTGPKIRLPPLDLPTFNGNRLDWLSFHDLFLAAIDSNTNLLASQKLQYLKAAVRGEAAGLIQGFKISDGNYSGAWDTLVARYEDKRLLVTSTFDRLLGIQPLQIENPAALQKMFDMTRESVRCIDILSVPKEEAYDILIIHLISKKLDSAARRQWERTIKPGQLPSLEEFCQFGDLQARVTGAAKEVQKPKPVPEPRKSGAVVHHGQADKTPSTSSSSKVKCILCKDDHTLYSCQTFKQMTVDERWTTVKKQNLCFNCLSGRHRIQDCKSSNCRKCGKKHNSLLHNGEQTKFPEKSHQQQGEVFEVLSAVATNGKSKGLLSTALIRIQDSSGEFQLFRALVDQGSETSFISSSCATRLGLRRAKIQVPLCGIAGASAGVCNEMVELAFTSCHNFDPKFKVKGLVLKSVTKEMPSSFIKSDWEHLRGLQLADPHFSDVGKIDVLLGADIVYELFEPGKITGPPGAPIAIFSSLGWILGGRIENQRRESVSTFMVQCELESQLKKFWELEELPRQQFLTLEEKACEDHFARTHTRDKTGRFIVRLPIKETAQKLEDSRQMAVRRFLSGERRNIADPIRQKIYKEVMDEYLQLGHMELVPPDEMHSTCPTYYMPHHAVENPSSTTTPFRVVFDASARSATGVSLNQTLMVGPKLQDGLVPILIRFRLPVVAFGADSPKFYRQTRIDKDDVDLQRIVWRSNPNEPLRDYRLLTATFGTAAAPYLAIKSLQQLALDEQARFPAASIVVRRDFYVDDLLTGASSVQEAIHLQQQLLQLMECGGFGLRKWSSNSESFLASLPADLREDQGPLTIEEDKGVKTLGLQWHPAGDYFSFRVAVSSAFSSTLTKRMVLSEIAKIFDPLGWLSPFIVVAKLYMKKMWKLNLGWDDQLCDPLKSEWQEYREQLVQIGNLHIPRFISQEMLPRQQLHGFCDASESAYAAVVFLRSVNAMGEIKVQMIAAKSRVTPTKIVSLPKLELCGAVLLVRLLQVVKDALQIQLDGVYGWTDSTIVLAWLASPPHRWKTFVANRVSEIQDILPRESWRHVISEENPADCASRGISSTMLVEHHLWWTGPSWLSSPEETWRTNDFLPAVVPPEERAVVNVLHVAEEDALLLKYSDLSRLLRITIYCRRAMTLLIGRNRRPQSQQQPGTPAPINSDEMETALTFWIKRVQKYEFDAEIRALMKKQDFAAGSKLRRLSPFLDEMGILRVGGRLQKSHLHSDGKHQIVLPKKSHFTQMIIRHQHSKDLHTGPQALLTSLQQKYWILAGRDVVRHFVRKCTKCCRFRAQCSQQKMGELPAARVTAAPPFQRTGVDYAGPFSLTARRGRGQKSFKSYVALFVCLVTRAIHLELVSDLTTEAFLAALRRFIARRGKPTDLYSDCGTNFVGAKRTMDQHRQVLSSGAHHSQLQQELAADFISWHFNPPASPHFGGLFEAGVKSMKYHLRRVVGLTILTTEEMMTLLAQIEACLNSRPITELSSDPADLLPLTPGHFLIGRPLTALPDPDLSHLKESHLSRWQRVQQMYQHFWRRWSSEYLSRLQQRNKWPTEHKDIQLGTIVLIRDETLPPAKWNLGRVIETYPGDDKLIRVVKLRTSTGELKRPIAKLCVLPIE